MTRDAFRDGASSDTTNAACPTERVRLPAWAWHVERQFGKKIPQCVNCGSHDLVGNFVRASYNCQTCGMELSDRFGVRWVPADPSARNPDEEHLPEGIWLERFRKAVRDVR